MKIVLGFVLAGVAAGCVVSGEEPEAEVTQALGCQSWGCGTNSPTIGDGLLFDELDSSGAEPNRGGIFVVGAKLRDGTPVRVGVVEDMLVADAGGVRYTGTQLEGTVIRLYHKEKGGYELLIDKVNLQSLRFWSGSPEIVPAYDIKARKVGELLFKDYACKNDVIVTDPHWSGIEHDAIVFQGDRYDPEHKLVWETPSTDPWFNVACAATTPAKLHLMRHTRAGSYRDDHTIGWNTAVKERQAMLKMFAADFCGTGETFTHDGVPLVYDDSNFWYREYGPYTSQEALWSAEGPLCLDNPRLGRTKQDVETECGHSIPSCGNFYDVFNPWYSQAHVMSALP
jgi:hypothetical protein